MQTTNKILMIRPVNFSFNAETAVNNAFQTNAAGVDTHQKALGEFNDFVSLLRDNGVEVLVIDDTPEPYTPDSVFPNNWLSLHHDGTLVLYPMFATNRRLERKQGVLDQLKQRFSIKRTIDLSPHESGNLFLEGTGSMVLDHDARIAYACKSPRTDLGLLAKFGEALDYRPVAFSSFDQNNQPVYHTNVMMCVADKYVVVCLDSITDSSERDIVEESIKRSGKEIVSISLAQMNRFAGNMLQVHNRNNEKLLVMSTQAYSSLTGEQRTKLASFNRIIHSPLASIETNGGGSARCMMAEIYLPEATNN
jgi:hypothetical protein